MTDTLVRLLSDGQFHSGQEIGRQLGITRAAVWKQVCGLRGRGLQVDSVVGRGYRVPDGLELLDVHLIRDLLSSSASAHFVEIELFDETTSTNSVAASRVRAGGRIGYACLAEQQSAGRGRRGRAWYSPYARNIYISAVREFAAGFSSLSGLSLAVGVAICGAIESRCGAEVGIKWPNDIVSNGAKLGGVLVEISGDPQGSCTAIIGVGINVAMPADALGEIDQEWTDLARITGKQHSRNELAADLLNSLASMFDLWDREGLTGFCGDWKRLDILYGEEVRVLLGSDNVYGIARGVGPDGALQVSTADGLRAFAAGEVSVRRGS